MDFFKHKKWLFLYTDHDEDCREIRNDIKSYFLTNLLSIEVTDKKTKQLLQHNSKGLIVKELPCFVDCENDKLYYYDDWSEIKEQLLEENYN